MRRKPAFEKANNSGICIEEGQQLLEPAWCEKEPAWYEKETCIWEGQQLLESAWYMKVNGSWNMNDVKRPTSLGTCMMWEGQQLLEPAWYEKAISSRNLHDMRPTALGRHMMCESQQIWSQSWRETANSSVGTCIMWEGQQLLEPAWYEKETAISICMIWGQHLLAETWCEKSNCSRSWHNHDVRRPTALGSCMIWEGQQLLEPARCAEANRSWNLNDVRRPTALDINMWEGQWLLAHTWCEKGNNYRRKKANSSWNLNDMKMLWYQHWHKCDVLEGQKLLGPTALGRRMMWEGQQLLADTLCEKANSSILEQPWCEKANSSWNLHDVRRPALETCKMSEGTCLMWLAQQLLAYVMWVSQQLSAHTCMVWVDPTALDTWCEKVNSSRYMMWEGQQLLAHDVRRSTALGTCMMCLM